MIETLIILAAAAARYAQGNGHAGPGRWALLAVMGCAGYFGPMDGQHLSLVETWSVAGIAVAGWATVAFGYTDWGNWKYSLLRYGALPVIVSATAFMATGRSELLMYSFVAPVLTAIYYFVAEHKPQWLINIVGNRDVAAALAGVTVGALVLL